jgi:Fic family protein
METIFHAWPEIPITENHIKQLHRDLLRYSAKDDRHRGEYKKLPNSVAAFDDTGQQLAVVFETASPFDTPRLMAELIAWLREAQKLKRLHPLLVIAIFTVVFLEIHPFQDGNGRLSRVLTALLLLKAGYAYVPYSSLEGVIENSKEGYYLALRQTQGTLRTTAPNWQPWLIFLLRALQQQECRLAAKVERERVVIAALPELDLQIIDYVREHGRVTMADMVRVTGASRNTLKDHFRSLVEKQYLTLHGTGKGSWYALPYQTTSESGVSESRREARQKCCLLAAEQTQHIGDVALSAVVGPPQRRFASLVFGIDVGPVDEQELRHIHATGTGRFKQGRQAQMVARIYLSVIG